MWSPSSWRTKPIKQDVIYDNQKALLESTNKLTTLPPLVQPAEIDRLRSLLSDVSKGRAFLLQGGDCAESFDDCVSSQIEPKVKVLLQMSLIMVWGARIPVVRIARMAGQYAKPRSSPMETLPDGRQVNSFRGHNVNGVDVEDRTPDPQRLVAAYFHAAATLNYLRGLLNAGFADLHAPLNWNLDWIRSTQIRERYGKIVDRLLDCLNFMKTIGADHDETLRKADIYTSHEGLMLDFEESMTRQVIGKDGSQSYYNLGAHFIWIGDRTRQLNGAHVEYFRGIKNPLGLKVGPSMTAEDLVNVLDILDPNCEPGKVTLISRYGVNKVEELLPDHIRAVQETRHQVIWACDPMHGNTHSSTSHPHLKTRSFEDILAELKSSLRIHQESDSTLNAVHFEMTGESVTECEGGSIETQVTTEGYQTFCDPRLNYEQSMELAFLIAEHWRDRRIDLEVSSSLASSLNGTL